MLDCLPAAACGGPGGVRHLFIGRRLRLQLGLGQGKFRLEDQRRGDVPLLRPSPRQAIAGGNWMEIRVRRIPFDLQAAPRRIIGAIVGHRPNHDGVHAEDLGQSPRVGRPAQGNLVVLDFLLDHIDRHHFIARHRLQFVVIGQRHAMPIEGRLGTQIEKRGDGDFGKLGIGVVQHRLMRDFRQHGAAGREDAAEQSDISQHLLHKQFMTIFLVTFAVFPAEGAPTHVGR